MLQASACNTDKTSNGRNNRTGNRKFGEDLEGSVCVLTRVLSALAEKLIPESRIPTRDLI